MSDLAPFVASTLRDKVVQDLMEENKKLREDLEKARATVEVTGPNGQPVYASAFFKDGTHAGNPNLWQVDFSESESIALGDLSNVQIHVGGILRAQFRNNSEFVGSLHESDEDGEDQKVINFCFAEGSGGLWLSVLVQGWPEESWRPLADEDLDNGLLLDILSEEIAPSYADARVTILHISFFVSTVRRALGALSLDPAIEEDRERRRSQQQFNIEIMGRMRRAGDEDTGNTFAGRLWELQEALESLGVYGEADLHENLIDGLIQLQQRTGDGPGFRAAVREIREALEMDGVDAEEEAGNGNDDTGA